MILLNSELLATARRKSVFDTNIASSGTRIISRPVQDLPPTHLGPAFQPFAVSGSANAEFDLAEIRRLAKSALRSYLIYRRAIRRNRRYHKIHRGNPHHDL